MDTKEIFNAVGNFGFPMVLSWYLLLRMEQRLDKLTSQSVEYIMESLSNTTQPIKNIRAYLRTVILNAPGTMESYYQVQANAAVAASSHPPAPAGSLMAGAVRRFGQKRRDGA